MAVVIYSSIDGVFLGSWMGIGMWSKHDATSASRAAVFTDATAADEHMATWDGGRLSYLSTVEILEDEKVQFASLETCVRAGLPAWG
jgi:hypothetical protein